MAQVVDTPATGFAVRTDASALHRSAMGSITGQLFLEIGGGAFPEQGWNDFPVVVLGWWIRAVLGLQRGGVTASCMFMDGPFEFELKRAGPGAWEFRLLESRADSVQVIRSGRVNPEDVLLCVHAAASAVLDHCKQQGWSSRDVDELQAARNALSQ